MNPSTSLHVMFWVSNCPLPATKFEKHFTVKFVYLQILFSFSQNKCTFGNSFSRKLTIVLPKSTYVSIFILLPTYFHFPESSLLSSIKINPNVKINYFDIYFNFSNMSKAYKTKNEHKRIYFFDHSFLGLIDKLLLKK